MLAPDYNLHCLANGANQLCGVASEGDVYAFNLLHRDFHVLDKERSM